MNTKSFNNSRPSLDEIYQTMFDFGLYSNITPQGSSPMTPAKLSDWMQRNLIISEYSEDVAHTIAKDISKAFTPIENNEAFKWFVKPSSPLFPDGNDPSKNFIGYLALLGNLHYNIEIGSGNEDPSDMFHYADALTSPDNFGPVGSEVSYPVLTALMFKQDPDMERMYMPRMQAVFPHLVFDLDKWQEALKFGAKKISVLPAPSPADFVNTVSARFDELGGGDKLCAISSLSTCVMDIAKADPSVSFFRDACKALAGLPALTCSYSHKDRPIIMDQIRDLQMGISKNPVDFSILKSDVVDPYDEYEKEFGPITQETPESTARKQSPFRKRVAETLTKLLDKLGKDSAGAPMQDVIGKLAIVVVERGLEADKVLKDLKPSDKEEVTVKAIQEYINKKSRDSTKHLNDSFPEMI